MNLTVLDCESTISNKGNPFDQTNKLCAVGLLVLPKAYRPNPQEGSAYHDALKIEYDSEPYGETLRKLQTLLDETILLILFNGKFDLNWITRYGIILPPSVRVWDAQLFEHFASNQSWMYPDLETAAQKRGLTNQKQVDIEAYWKAGINTTDIEWPIVENRVISDVDLTYELYQKQLEIFATWSKARQNLFTLQCQDLLVLQQIERNGFYYDEEESKTEADSSRSRLLGFHNEITEVVGDTRPNLNSDEHLSALLYGGSITYDFQIPNGVFKSGQKAGQTRYRWEEETVIYPRLVQPLEHTESQKTQEQIKVWKLEGKSKEEISKLIQGVGIWSTDKKILGRILWGNISQKARKLVSLILQHSAETRSLTSYLNGLPKLIEKMHWPQNMLYGTINQVVVRTGRTSSSKPNRQNFDGDLKVLFKSRFPYHE